MKNKKLIVITVVVLLILAGAFFFLKGKQAANISSSNPAGTAQNSPADAVKQGLLGLLENASGVKCSVTDASGSYTVVAKGEKVKIDGISFANPTDPSQANKKGTMINDGTWAYIWNGTQGMKFNLKDMQAANPAPGQNPDQSATDWKQWATSMQNSGAKYDCNPTVATDADFTPPTDVQFQDLGALLKGLQNMPKNSATPAIPNIPSQP